MERCSTTPEETGTSHVESHPIDRVVVEKEVHRMTSTQREHVAQVRMIADGLCCIPEAPTGLIPDVVTCLA
eukprot:23172-Hanusia_phi.AAC.1